MRVFPSFAVVTVMFCLGTFVMGQGSPRTINVTFTTVDVVGAGYSMLWGVNNTGTMLGSYGQDTDQDAHGFLYSGSTFTYFDYPGQNFTVPTGINDFNLIVGYAGQSSPVGFLYDGTTFTTIKAPNRSATFTNGINNAGYIVGGAGTIYDTAGFELRNGLYKKLPLRSS